MKTIHRLALTYDIRTHAHAPKFGAQISTSIAQECLSALANTRRPWDWRPTPGAKHTPAVENRRFDEDLVQLMRDCGTPLSTAQVVERGGRNLNMTAKALLRLEKRGQVTAIRTRGKSTFWGVAK